MIRAKFVCKEHEEYGGVGWAMVGKPDFDPLTGMAIPHDILEHFPNDPEGVESEWMALGASLWVRGDEYFVYRGNRYSAAKNIASEFREHYYFLVKNDLPIDRRDPGKYTIPEEIESDLEEIFAEAKKVVIDEIDPAFLSDENIRKAKGWFVKGYRRAQKRFKGISQSWLCSVFMHIEDEVNRLTKYAEEGQELTVAVNVQRDIVNARLDYPEEEY